MASSLVKDSTITFLTRILLFILGMGTSIIVARVLGPSAKGSYNILRLVITVVSLLVLFGLGSANVYYGSRDPDSLAVLAGNSIVAAFGLGFVGIIIVELATLLPIFQNYLLTNDIPVQWVRWLILLLPIIQLNAYLKEITRASGDMVRYNLIAVWRAFVYLSGVVILVLVFDRGIGGAVVAWILAVLLTSILIVWWALRITKGKISVRWQTLRRNFLFGIRLYPGNIAQFLNYRLDVFLVGLFLTPRDVGIYVTATMLAEKLWEIPRAISTVLLHRIASERDSEIAAATTARISRVIAFLIGGMSLLVVVASYPIIYLMYGQAYLPAASALIALVPGIWFLSVGKLLATHLSATGRPEIGTLGAIVSLTATFVLDFLLIPRIGIIGASIASSVSYMLSTTIFVIIFLRSASLPISDVILMTRGDVILLYKAFGNMRMRHLRKT